MAKARKKVAAKKAAKAPKGVVRKFKSSAVGVRRKAPKRSAKPAKKSKPAKQSKSITGRVVDAIKEAASLRGRLGGHETFED